jgi:hypothetical protein
VHFHVASLLDSVRLELRELKARSTLFGACSICLELGARSWEERTVIRPVGERQWEDVNWDGEGHRTCINTKLGTFAGCCTLAWLPWAADNRLHARGTTGR